MNVNEQAMKDRGEARVWKAVQSKEGKPKKMSSTQLGQQLMFTEALDIFEDIKHWIYEGSAKVYRSELKNYFTTDEFLLEKLTETLLLLANLTYYDYDSAGKTNPTRHKKVDTIRRKVLTDLSFDQAWRFLEVVIDRSEYFEVVSDVVYKNNYPNRMIKYKCNLSEVLSSKLAAEAYVAFFPQPMLKKPLDWYYDGEEIYGGYETYQYPMIRTKSMEVDYSMYSDKIFQAINYIQSIPWKVNRAVVMRIGLDLKIPKKEDFIKSEYPEDELCRWDVDLNDAEVLDQLDITEKDVEDIKARRSSFSEKAELYNAEVSDFESALGKYRAVKLALNIAERYMDEEELYFPHSFDFRGRIYPLPVGLSPQGSDAVKAMLEYAEGEVLTKEGEDWSWSYLASLYGDDKIPFEERIERGKELIDVDYRDADEPYQFLAHQLEMRKYLADKNYPVRARIHLDACNSGSQFTSAITGDRAGCIATNVIPTINPDGSQERQDAYLLVSDKAKLLSNKMINVEEDPERKEVLEFILGLLKENGRKICKVPVMVSNYGGTAGGRAEILWNMMRELGCDRKWITKKNASLFGKVIGDSIAGVLNGGKAFESYIQKMNMVIARKNRPVQWYTSDGFFVNHMKFGELKRKQVKCMLPGSRRPTTINKKLYSDKLSPAKMKSAISPNYIHSLDAELLRRVALRMGKEGIEYSDWIHDSFGCHPNYVDRMLTITKEEFKKLVRRQPLKVLDKELRSQADNSKTTQNALDEIKMPRLKGFDVANGGLDIVMESDWFFS